MKYPLILNCVRFLINPNHLNITKPLSMGELETEKGVEFQTWYEKPETLEIDGLSAGKSAYKELQFLKHNFARTNKTSELYYKNRLYKGIITKLTVDAAIRHLYEYDYVITFQLLHGQTFAIEDFSVKSGGYGTNKTHIGEEWTSFKKDFKEQWSDITKSRPFGT